MTTWTVRFDRIGRKQAVPPLTVRGTADDLRSRVHGYAGNYLISREYDVTVDLRKGLGWIDGGRFGTFTITEQETA